tara:strand:- start:83 stop:379 length:297 start_codon:yes stop_codon:yes gene_type:complete
MNIKFIVHVKKWFDKYNGNTYHSLRIIRIKDKEILKCSWQYGYGTQYRVTALDKMIKEKWIPQKYKETGRYEFDNDYPIYWIDEGHGLKKDMVAWGDL